MLQVTLAAVLWGTTGIAVVFLGEKTPLTPTAIGFYRLLIASVVLVLFVLAARRFAALVAITRAAPGMVVLTGIGLGAYQALYFISVATAGVSVATVVSLGIAPVVTATWEAVRARRRPSPRTIAIIVAALTGLTLISAAEPAGAGTQPVVGLLAAIGSGVTYAVSTLLSRDLSQRTDATTLTTTTSLVGALALLPIAAVQGLAFDVRADVAGLLAYTGIVTTAVAYALFYAGLRSVPGSVAAVLTLLEPLTAAVLAVLILSEPLPALTVAGGLVLLGAVAALYVRPRSYQAVSVVS